MAAMIARVWRGAAATQANADAYEHHVRVLPALGEWESMAAVRRFAGDEVVAE